MAGDDDGDDGGDDGVWTYKRQPTTAFNIHTYAQNVCCCSFSARIKFALKKVSKNLVASFSLHSSSSLNPLKLCVYKYMYFQLVCIYINIYIHISDKNKKQNNKKRMVLHCYIEQGVQKLWFSLE